jgi:hypothetical protein
MASFKGRTLIEQPLYVAAKEALGPSCERLDEILDGLTTKMSVEPTYFPLAPGMKGVRRARSKAYPPDIPSYRIWFTYDSGRIILELIEITPVDELPNPTELS